MSLAHPDPEGHLTDITLTALVRLRDDARNAGPNEPYLSQHLVELLDTILEPWGEATITDD